MGLHIIWTMEDASMLVLKEELMQNSPRYFSFFFANSLPR